MNLYVIKHTVDETELCILEKKCLFKSIDNSNLVYTDMYIDVDRSPFVKYCIRDIIVKDSLENLIEYIKAEKISYDAFKVKYLDIENMIDFDKGHEIESYIGYEIIGNVKLSKPAIILGVTQINGQWIFGEYVKNNAKWLENKNRPQGYCNALTNRVSRAVVNILVGDNYSLRIIDPCCGVGTVVIEGLSMGLNIIGSDINENIIRGAKNNLRFFGYPEVVKVADIHEISGHYDIAIVDLPYGILSITDKEMQMDIIKSAGHLCDKLAVLGIEDIAEELIKLGFKIIEKCIISKGKFKRNLYICLT
jgi:tRNA (guanine10-N2)-dimethyltransferase